jgi:hypothetical protein
MGRPKLRLGRRGEIVGDATKWCPPEKLPLQSSEFTRVLEVLYSAALTLT